MSEVSEHWRDVRSIFDEVATEYDAVRPTYPAAVYDDILALAGTPAGGDLLEIGCGTGQATLPLAERGYHIDGIELGERLAAIARAKLAAYPRVTVRVGAFETEELAEGAYDLIFSATAFHWVMPASYPKLVHVLRRGGSIALFWNKHIASDFDRDFFERTQTIIRQFAPEIYGDGDGLPTLETIRNETEGLAATGLFGEFTVRHYLWERRMDTREYIALLDTYSDFHSLPADRRQRLYDGLATIAEKEFGGQITQQHVTSLYVARRRP